MDNYNPRLGIEDKEGIPSYHLEQPGLFRPLYNNTKLGGTQRRAGRLPEPTIIGPGKLEEKVE